jgi:hypothetical protein
MAGFARLAAWTLGSAVVGLLIGFGIAYLIWTLDGQPSKGDVWAGLAALIIVCMTGLGAAFGLHNGSD